MLWRGLVCGQLTPMDQILLTTVPIDQLAQQVADHIVKRLPQQALDKPSEKFMSAIDAADHLGITVPTLRKWRREGLIPFHRVGSRIYFDRQEIDVAVKQAGPRRMRQAFSLNGRSVGAASPVYPGRQPSDR